MEEVGRGGEKLKNQLKRMRWRRGRGEENGSRMEGEGREGKMLVADAPSPLSPPTRSAFSLRHPN
jgi:hypothetical protein